MTNLRWIPTQAPLLIRHARLKLFQKNFYKLLKLAN